MSPMIAPDVKEVLANRGHASAAAHKDRWSRHAAANKGRIVFQVSRLWCDVNPKTGVLIAAGPSLKDSLAELKAIDRNTHEIVCVDMALKFLLDNGLVPDYVICADASEEIARTLVAAPPEVALLLNVVVHPDTAKDWVGDIFWFCMMSNYRDKEANDWMQHDHAKKSGVSSFLVPGGNVSSLGVSFLGSVRAVAKILLYGHDFCWTDDAEFYAGGVQKDLADIRIKTEADAGTVMTVPDSRGKPVKTTGSLLAFASWYSDIARTMPGLLESRTPTTILSLGGN
ncbi:MAG: DUF115 domain-containing protein [Sphingomonadales bacterium]|nr:DUF115 domain-containing protein [Sphingomonadaceae bacterium]MBS3930421.1 DUF115 domain-containing protein [Sphingomonadales bacterium]